MSSNTNPLLAQNRAQLVARLQARQAHNRQRQLAHQANHLAAFAAQNPNINPALIFHHYGAMIGIRNPALQQHTLQQPSSQPPHQITFQQSTLQQPTWPGQVTLQQAQQNQFQQLQQSTVQQPTLQNAVVQNHVLPHVTAIQNAAAVNPAVPSQTTKPKRKRAVRKPKKALKDGPFPLMELPLEIRTMIYKCLLEEQSAPLTLLTQGLADEEVVRRGYLNKQKKNSGRQVLLKTVHKANDKRITHLIPGILRVCKTIYEEAVPILYGQTLEFEHPIALQKFLLDIGIHNRLLLQRIVLRGWQRDVFPVWQQALSSVFDRLLSAHNLKSVQLDRHTYSGSDNDSMYNDTKDWVYHANHLSARIEFWAQSIDAAKGKGTARALLTFSDRNFHAEDNIAQGDQAFLDRKKFFLEKLKLSSK
ncbi:hypothetical protein E4T44_03168 [Aureobasidium sp. EXF-8845]|nr:hypothetical protein E4T44_03168 [Aureobasidium sp. EXF-8845]KAI4854248.1 hypothetical protein E4T45_04038 [Aureobasidium sp. EXF-8846]